MPQVAFPRRSCFRLTLRSFLLTTMFACLFGSSLIAHAQKDFTRIYGAEDQSVPMPAFTGSLGQKDAAALQELIDYLKAVNIGAWKGLQATGTMTDSSGANNQATLTVLNSDQFRLDVQTSKGERSTRISGSFGKTLEVDGRSFYTPPATAKAGLLAFPRLLDSTFPNSATSLVDRGQVQIDGRSLHRITIEEPAFPGNAVTDQRNVSVTDLYFDASTHLLIKSAGAVQLDSADRQRYLVVVTYGDYQKVQGGLLPHQYSQSLNGQRQWTLQLNAANLQPSVDSTYFQF